MEYLEDLTNIRCCPPLDAISPDGVAAYYRLIDHDPPTWEDIRARAEDDGYIKLEDSKKCKSKSCSIFGSNYQLKERFLVKGNPAMQVRYRKSGIFSVILKLEDGKIKEGKDGHFDWWVSRSFFDSPNRWVKEEKI